MAVALRLLVLLLLPLRAGAEPSQAEAEIRRLIEDFASQRHVRIESLDPDQIVAEALPQKELEPDAGAFSGWLRERLETAFLAFAPAAAVHDDSTRYRLPFNPQIPRYVTQGVGGEFSHRTAEDYHAVDFVMPIGTPVLAARRGRVARVVDGFHEGGPDPSLSRKANAVFVLHGDGTFAVYAHLKEGIDLREGERVAPGKRLGLSGFTGYGVGPHLHFVVRRRTGPTTQESVPILFGPRSQKGFVPEKKRWYGALPRAPAALMIRVNGDLIDQATELPVRRGDTLLLEVTRISAAGQQIDVTSDELTKYISLTPWAVDVIGKGRITVTPAEGFEHQKDIDRSRGTVAILHGDRRAGLRIGAVAVRIAE